MLRHYQPPNPLIMGADQLRTSLIEQINTADESFLRVVHALAEAYRLEHTQEVAGYQAGEEVTIHELKAKVEVAEDQIDRGEFLTAEELEKETEEWLSKSIG